MMKRLRNWILTAVMGMALTAAGLGMAVPAYAEEAIDISKKGSITITLSYEGKAVTDGEVALMKVADLVEKDGSIEYACTTAFKGCESLLEEMDPLTIGADLNKKVTSSAKKDVKKINSDGQAVYSDMSTGVYLVTQTTASKGYQAFDPVVIELPIPGDGTWIYDVDASPKLEVAKTPSAGGETKPPSGGSSSKGKLPQTGQLNWPIPVLAGAGLFLILLGLALRLRAKHR